MEQIIHELQDMTYLNWSQVRGSSGTAGSFLKSWESTPEGKIYYKLSNYDAFHGWEERVMIVPDSGDMFDIFYDD